MENNQLNEINKFRNKDSKIIIGNMSYESLKNKFEQDQKTIEDNLTNDESSTNQLQEIWNALGKSILITAPSIDGEDMKNYQIIVFAPNGQPIPITPPFNAIDTSIFEVNEGVLTLQKSIKSKLGL